ncbi:MAG: hypothetical protein ABR878_10915 [Roseiarcus sp.]|jgi:hypothetical protein
MIQSLAAVASLVPDSGSASGWFRGARGAPFLDEPRRDAYGIVAAFFDPRGGKRDLPQPARQGERAAP